MLPWRSTLFTDEKTWWYGKEGQSFVWTDDIDDPKLNNEQVKHPYKVHAWGGISWYGKTDLYLFEENMDTDLFCKILRTKMLPGAKKIFSGRRKKWYFQQDNDPKHTSKKAQDLIKSIVPAQIPKSDWPPNSPDLNPIENIWGILSRRLEECNYKGKKGFHSAIRKQWRDLELDTIRNSIKPMKRYLKEVRKNKGGHISKKYTRR